MSSSTAVNAAVVTRQRPKATPAGTFAVICVGELTVKGALALPRVTACASPNPVPVSVTDEPTPPLSGEKLEIVGGETEKTISFTSVPAALLMRQRPYSTRCGTVAVICVGESTVKVPGT